jgi:1-acyl-sn-glycerol-3-phosphate acyltransferase
MEALDNRYIIGIAPEGKRSRDGSMRQAHPGVALLTSRKRIPIYPVVHWGFVDFLPCLKRLRRARVVFRVGEPFYVKQGGSERPSSKQLREITDEMMYRLAALLPERLRGYYSDLSKMQNRHLEPVS